MFEKIIFVKGERWSGGLVVGKIARRCNGDRVGRAVEE